MTWIAGLVTLLIIITLLDNLVGNGGKDKK